MLVHDWLNLLWGTSQDLEPVSNVPLRFWVCTFPLGATGQNWLTDALLEQEGAFLFAASTAPAYLVHTEAEGQFDAILFFY